MKILVLQLKRIGDLILTTPALSALRESLPEAAIILAVTDASAGLVPALSGVNETLVFHRHSPNAAAWKKVLSSKFNASLDFTGTDRSALLTMLACARERVGFQWVKKRKVRALVYNRFVDSAVRDHHTADHYVQLLRGMTGVHAVISADPTPAPKLCLPEDVVIAARNLAGSGEYAVIHPGSARAEKYWLPERWAELIIHLRACHGIECILTGGADGYERQHLAQIQRKLDRPCPDISGKIDLLTFAALIKGAKLCVSCDTSAVHFAAAFATPQVALYGVTNPFHWRPRHADAVVISAAQPDAPLTDFTPNMKGAAMPGISTRVVIRATDALLARVPAQQSKSR